MKQEEFDFIKDAFSQILDDIAGNPDWHDAASAVSADLGALERELEGKVVSPDKSLEEEIERYLHSLGLGHGGWVDGLADDDLRNLARHFAEWQKEQLKVILLKRDTEDIFAREYAIYSLPPFVVESIAYGTQLIDFIYKTAHHFYGRGFRRAAEMYDEIEYNRQRAEED